MGGALSEYEKKRDFGKTSEPQGGRVGAEAGGRVFVVQKHAARSLHYDFRLEHDGVLKSWAVPKGPSTDPADKRLAVEVEDHPLEYAGFEGVIPQGEYGGGAVLVWDRGTWVPEAGSEDVEAGLEAGSLKFELRGEKLAGSWALVRMKGRGERHWLLIKHADRRAARHQKTTVVERSPDSVLSGRSIEEVAEAGDAVWRGAGDGGGWGDPGLDEVEGVRACDEMPADVKPMLATLVDAVPEGGGWLYEIKYDGYRLVAVKDGESVRLLTRSGKDWSEKFPATVEAVAALPVGRVVLDGELCALDGKGVTRFQKLQGALRGGTTGELVYFCFDLLWCEGFDVRRAELRERKRLLKAVLARGEGRGVRYSDHLEDDGAAFHEKACETGLEGIMAKRAVSSYYGKRTRDWRKVKCGKRQEFVIGGFTEPGGERTGFGALLLGVREAGGLRYCGKVGTGFSERQLEALHGRLMELERGRSAFEDGPTGGEAAGVTWVAPELVGEVSFTEWTDGGLLRHPSFLGLRDDKDANGVKKERVMKTATGGVNVSGVAISHPGRVVFPDAGATKGDVAAYYAEVAERLLEYAGGRPLSVVRCPSGRQKSCFFQKHRGEGMPDAVGAVSVDGSDYLTVDTVEGVVSLVQFGVLELHPWQARNDDLERPDRMVFDLDPGEGVEWGEVLGAAHLMRDTLRELGLESWPMLTGGKGIHVIVPLTRRAGFDVVKPAAKAVSERLREKAGGKFVTVATKAKRKGRIYLDYLRNGRGATSVCPYSLRARAAAPVAVPLRWDEVVPGLTEKPYSMASVRRRLAALEGDPWEGFGKVRQSLTKRVLGELGVD